MQEEINKNISIVNKKDVKQTQNTVTISSSTNSKNNNTGYTSNTSSKLVQKYSKKSESNRSSNKENKVVNSPPLVERIDDPSVIKDDGKEIKSELIVENDNKVLLEKSDKKIDDKENIVKDTTKNQDEIQSFIKPAIVNVPDQSVIKLEKKESVKKEDNKVHNLLQMFDKKKK